MEETGYWMVESRETKCEDESWEERAFAEDAAGMLGGYVWPPRSYSCNFCRREFRSAQALGGHMNVHRRDRARMKLFPIPQNLNSNPDHHNPPNLPEKRFNLNHQVSMNHTSSSFLSSIVLHHDNTNLTYLCLNNDDINKNKRKQHKGGSSYINFSVVENTDVPNIHKRRKLIHTSASTIITQVEDQTPKVDIPKNDIDLELRLGDRPKVQ